jgi:uncharacterized protein (DUF4415 family)
MPKLKQGTIIPSDAEEAAIQRGIAADPENPEWTEKDFASARSAAEVVPEVVQAASQRRLRGPQKAPTKVLTSVRLDRDVLDALRAGGDGWQGRVNKILRKALLG